METLKGATQIAPFFYAKKANAGGWTAVSERVEQVESE
jgi:hypothetical protein